MRRHLASLTSRLVLTTVVLVLAVSVLIGAATTLAMRSYLQDQLDQQVEQALRTPPGGPGTGLGTLRVELPDDRDPSGVVAETGANGRGRLVELTDDQIADLTDVPADGHAHSVDVADLGGYRVRAEDVPGGTVVAGLPDKQVDNTLTRLVSLEVLFALLAVLVAAGTALVVVRRQLRPLREVSATANAVAERPLDSGAVDLTERVPDHLTDERTEVGRVGTALNTLLAHVESSLSARYRSEQQVRQFVADASHELRTPLTTIAGYTELARRHGDATTTRTALAKVEDESRRMTALVEDLLLLARLDAGRPLSHDRVDLSRLLVEAVDDARVVDAGRRWQVALPADGEPVEVTGDAQRLHQVVTNLLTNARKYTPEGTTVTVTAHPDGFDVHDDGPGFPPELVGTAFERFTRGDAARHRDGSAGLGLALVQAIVTAHGGAVRLDSRRGSTTIAVRLNVRLNLD
ncbi:HAMP domain-containing sensor histidine kinase [Nocardioides sp. YIM 152315]|uniref:sensor histidine kinase n=1 Tax=Nocardioides sp. YIM 152315 TaxID=3031760 RepID=UPI0023DA4574|nr:HAMP domain-containing sensor histidine kinase [Nocardioides sp. YIM 152315]MDF1603823.1 HAMP domain-containing sensor histidine kinase [Nocardioides sp. YIM 152315]